MIALGVEAPAHVQNDVTTHPSFVNAFLAVTNIIFAFSKRHPGFCGFRWGWVLTTFIVAHVAFFGIMSEMEDVRDFPKSLAMLQVLDTTMYIITAMVIYRYAGPDVKSPALSSAGPLMSKVAYGLAIPTVCPVYEGGWSRFCVLISLLGHHRRCHLRPRRLQVHLRAGVAWVSPDAHEQPRRGRIVDRDRLGCVGDRLGDCRVHPRVQRPVESDCTCGSFPCARFAY